MQSAGARTALVYPVIVALALGAWSCLDAPPTRPPGTTGPGGFVADAAASTVILAAGDVATCGVVQTEATARLLDSLPGTVLPLGDLAYEDGTEAEFAQCYGPTWGRHRARSRPTPGNHEYHTAGAAPYYAYFGDAAGAAGQGYYAFSRGEWRLISLNSNIAADAASAQMQWLRNELATNPARCSIAYWHHPVFSSGPHGSNPHMAELWRVLDSAGVEVVLSAHDHIYERMARQNHRGVADTNGIRQFVVGTGGRQLYGIRSVHANSAARDTSAYGVLKLTMGSGSYTWEFVTTSGTVHDRGSGSCAGPDEAPSGNQPPVASAGGPYAGDEGVPFTLSASGSSDPEGGTLTYRWSFGDGTSATGMTVSKSYPNSGSFSASVTVTDPQGLSSTSTAAVEVRDVPPSATFGSPSSVAPGSAFALTLTNATDPSPRDVAAGFTYQFDCGKGWFEGWGTASSASCAGFASTGTRTVRGRVREMSSWAHREYTATLTVASNSLSAPEAPRAEANGPYAAAEGTSVSFSAEGSSDPGGGALAYQWDFGDGTTSTAAHPTRSYPNEGRWTVWLTVHNSAGATSRDSATVTISDVPPTATFVAPPSVRAGASFTLALTDASDISPRDMAAGFTYQFDCGQGWFGAWGTAAGASCPGLSSTGQRTVRGRVREMSSWVHREYQATLTVEP